MVEEARIADQHAAARGREGALALLAGALALALQLVLVSAHMTGASGVPGELAALTGAHNLLCADGADHDPGGPAHGGFDCSGLCCQLGHSAAALPSQAYLPLNIILAGLAEPSLLPALPTPPEPRRARAQPRGPPPTS
jgi:hypothetical protein